MRLTTGLALAVLEVSVGSKHAFPDTISNQPCAEIADYLSDFAERNPNLASDSGRAEFLSAAINLFEAGEIKESGVEALKSRQFDSALQAIRSLGEPIAEPNLERQLQAGDLGAGSASVYDARDFGGFVALNHVE